MTVSEDKEDNLFPSRLWSPSGETLASPQAPRRYGYPICWSQDGYEWCPYLPAVVNFKYPIFRGMTYPPRVYHDGSGYSLAKEEIALWQNIEFVMHKVAGAAGHRQAVSLNHLEPASPSAFGYAKSHRMEKFARRCALKSLNAFQRLLGYCSYCMAGIISYSTLGDHGKFFTDGDLAHRFYGKFSGLSSDVYILARSLLATLRQMKDEGNHAGVVVTYRNGLYDCTAVTNMLYHNVPVYVEWPEVIGDPYRGYSQPRELDKFRPSPEAMEALRNPPMPEPAAAPIILPTAPATRGLFLPAAETQEAFDHPMDYVKLRLQNIPGEISRSARPQSMKDRLASALKHQNLGSAGFFEFNRITVVDQATGQERVRWVREKLTKADAMNFFEGVDSCRLWHVAFILSLAFLL